jgi:hypothetical protein
VHGGSWQSRSALVLSLQTKVIRFPDEKNTAMTASNRTFLGVLICGVLALPGLANDAAVPKPASAWKPLFNGNDFFNWDIYVATPDGAEPLVPNVDPKNVFRVAKVDGGNVIHVSGEVYGAITTREEFDNFHFRVDFTWGTKRWPPRAKVGRDTGILYCCIGQPNPRTGWMRSIENNIMEKGVGQWWSVNGTIIDTEGDWITPGNELFVPYKREGDGEKNIVWRRGAPRLTATSANGITPPFDVEQVFGNWNTVEVVFWGGHCIHILNGHVNLIVAHPRYEEGGRWHALTQGRIQLQSEAAEVFYRNPEVRPLYELPPALLDETISLVAEQEEGFAPLLADGMLKDWKQAGPGKFTVEQGIATGEGGMGLWWYAGKQFANFVLRGEFLQEQEIADSGVFLRFPDPGEDPWVAIRKGHEVEFGDPKAEKPEARSGAIYPYHAPVMSNTKPPGQWNNYEIVCRGHDYSVRINGKLINTWTDMAKRASSGFIGLQNYNDQKIFRHRNVRIKPLP